MSEPSEDVNVPLVDFWSDEEVSPVYPACYEEAEIDVTYFGEGDRAYPSENRDGITIKSEDEEWPTVIGD